MTENDQEYIESQNDKSRAQHTLDYLRILRAVEDAIAPHKEHLKDVTKDYKDKGWLTAEEIKLTKKLKKISDEDTTFEEIEEVWNIIKNKQKQGGDD